MKFCRILTVVLGVWLLGTAAPALAKMAPDPNACLQCHEDVVSAAEFMDSVHGKNACTSCHVEVTDLDEHLAGNIEISPVNCATCHSTEDKAHADSVHAESGIGCVECHSDIHGQKKMDNSKVALVEKCSECHDVESYVQSSHGMAIAAGKNDSAACNDCHGVHNIARVPDPDTAEGGAFKSAPCIECHADEEKMKHAGVNAHAVETYLESYHGKNYRLGFPQQSAGCADCHSGHGVLPPSHAESTIGEAKIVETCATCHPKATAQFTKFYAHGDHGDRENYPIMYYTFISMTGLLVGTFAVFWIHTLLWMFRGFVENRQKAAALAAGHEEHHISEAHKQYRRFEKRHIFLHLTVIISFLGLSLTGLPLKFADQPWAQTMMSFFGGVHYAGLIHRGCAILTFYYFVGAILMSIDFLFIRKDIKAHPFVRLFGPDSLMPNFRDVRDVTAMVRWFFFKGPKPTFERWTYWEKFDFLAVFWGMFAIGGSGLLLWFPEIFGTFLPGWMFNVATIVHSDEALLATGFIFTVHFFNTHGRPEKFPMDFVIFNGQMSKEEFIEERGDQWKRYEEEGTTENYVVTKPSGVLYDFFFKGFGFLAFFTGITLAILMLYAFISG